MIDFLYQYGMFLAQVVTLVVAILVVIGGIVSAAARNRHRTSRDGELRVKHLNEEFDDLRESIVDQVLPEAERKAEHKKKRKEEKARNKQRKKAGAEAKSKPRMFVLDFNGDIQASDVARLRREITAVPYAMWAANVPSMTDIGEALGEQLLAEECDASG